LSLVLDRLGHVVYSHLCAGLAVELSGGDPRAILAYVSSLWRHRLPGSLVFYAEAARRRLHTIQDPSDRRRFRRELVRLRARAAFYHGHVSDAVRWSRALWQ